LEENFGIFISLIIVAFFIAYLFYSLHKKKYELLEIITDHYQEGNLEVTGILRLNMRERMRYGAPIVPFLSFVSYSNNFVRRSSDIDCLRKVELIDENDNEFTKYVEVLVENNEVVSFREFDSYDI